MSMQGSLMTHVLPAGLWLRFPASRGAVEGCSTKRISAPWCGSTAGLAKGMAWLSDASVSMRLSIMDSNWLRVEAGWSAVEAPDPLGAPRLEWQSMEEWLSESCEGMQSHWEDSSGARRDARMDCWREAGIYWDADLGGWMALSYVVGSPGAVDGSGKSKSKIDCARPTPMALTIWHWDHDMFDADWRLPELGDRDLLAMCEGMGAGMLELMEQGLSTSHAKPSGDCLSKIRSMGKARRERQILEQESGAGRLGQGAARV